MSPFYRAAVYKIYVDRHRSDVNAISYRHYAAAYKNSIVVEQANRINLDWLSFFRSVYRNVFSARNNADL